jgi:hypothetical protein
MSINYAGATIHYGLLFSDFPEAALPIRSQIPGSVKIRTGIKPSAWTPLQYEDEELEEAYEEKLSLEDFEDPDDFYTLALQNLASVYEMSIENLELSAESENFGGRWILGVTLVNFGGTEEAGTLAARPLSLTNYNWLLERARSHELLLQQWASTLGTEPPQIILTVQT